MVARASCQFELLDRPLVFDDAQEAVRRRKVPLVVVGSAGRVRPL